MDIYQYLKMDHKKVAHLFKLFNQSTLLKRQQEIVGLIIQELLVHAHSEQDSFYKLLIQYPKTSELSLHGKKEHQDIEEQINTVTKSWGNKSWKQTVLKLKDIVDHHVREEERLIFHQAKKVISDKEAIVLKEKMHYLKGKLLLSLENKAKKKQGAERKLKKLTPKYVKKAHVSHSYKSSRPH